MSSFFNEKQIIIESFGKIVTGSLPWLLQIMCLSPWQHIDFSFPLWSYSILEEEPSSFTAIKKIFLWFRSSLCSAKTSMDGWVFNDWMGQNSKLRLATTLVGNVPDMSSGQGHVINSQGQNQMAGHNFYRFFYSHVTFVSPG